MGDVIAFPPPHDVRASTRFARLLDLSDNKAPSDAAGTPEEWLESAVWYLAFKRSDTNRRADGEAVVVSGAALDIVLKHLADHLAGPPASGAA